MKIKQLLQQPEGRRLEFKEKLPSKANLCKSIIAFANDAGGLLFIGIKNSPRKPDVPGRPSPARAKTINKKEYFGK